MDKRKVIAAYHRGFITIKECAQILGIDSMEIMGMVSKPLIQDKAAVQRRSKQPVNS